jgi:hypothetical protein
LELELENLDIIVSIAVLLLIATLALFALVGFIGGKKVGFKEGFEAAQKTSKLPDGKPKAPVGSIRPEWGSPR